MKRSMVAVAAVLVAAMVLAPGTASALTTTEWTEYGSNPVYAPGKAYYPTILKDAGVYTMWSDCASGVQKATSAGALELSLYHSGSPVL